MIPKNIREEQTALEKRISMMRYTLHTEEKEIAELCIKKSVTYEEAIARVDNILESDKFLSPTQKELLNAVARRIKEMALKREVNLKKSNADVLIDAGLIF